MTHGFRETWADNIDTEVYIYIIQSCLMRAYQALPLQNYSLSPRSYSHALAPQYIHASRSSEAKPLGDIPDGARHTAGRGEAALQEGARIAEARRPVVRHEELGRSVDHGQAAALRVPRRVDGRVARLEVDLVGEEGELAQRGRDVARLGHYGQGLGKERSVSLWTEVTTITEPLETARRAGWLIPLATGGLCPGSLAISPTSTAPRGLARWWPPPPPPHPRRRWRRASARGPPAASPGGTGSG